MTVVWTPAALDAMLSGGLAALINAGTSPAYIVVRDASASTLVTLVATQPAVEFVAHELLLTQQDASGDLIMASGVPVAFSLHNGQGVAVAHGDVSDESGDGALQVGGTAEDGRLLLGGRAILVSLPLAFDEP